MARTRSIHRRAAAAAALSTLCLGFTLPAAASDTAHQASQDGLERAAEARDRGDTSDGGDVDDGSITIQGIAWK